MVIPVPHKGSGEVFLPLSPDLMLVYVLHPSGLVGRLTSGRVSRNGSDGLAVYDQYGRLMEYLSKPSGKIRSWCLVEPAGKPVDGWSEVHPDDVARIFPA